MTFVYLWLLAPFALVGLGVWIGYTIARNEDGPAVQGGTVGTSTLLRER